MKRILILLFIFSINNFGQNLRVDKIEPPNWWAGLDNNVQLMIYGKNLSGYEASFNTWQISVRGIHKAENSDYSFIDITIAANITPGKYELKLAKGNESAKIIFPVLKRETDSKKFQGFSDDDIVYLIMPDRFADGDTSNNIVKGMINDFNPAGPNGRHGGDLQGIIDHLGYLKELGVTSLWLTPVLENNTPVSYHGYAATDLYKVDPRLGNNEKYKELVNKAHAQGLKIIYDHVSNHIGLNHPWMKNLPFHDWINGTKENHLNAWHDKMIRWDTHSAQLTDDHLTKGWFVNEMPDLNQNNPFVKNYLIQNTLWWIEYAGLDGIREDTYPYVEPDFMSEWARKILKIYPRFNIVGEIWTGDAVFLAPYQRGSALNKGTDTNLPAITDFPLKDAYSNFLSGKSNLHSIYNVIAMDYLYKNPNDLLVFADNHDLSRVMYNAGGNADKVKLVLTHMLTSRGIPQIFYGTEIGMRQNGSDGLIRSDFTGGFQGDTVNYFDSKGRTHLDNDLFSFIQKLISVRGKYKSLSRGTLKHLPPVENVYLYTKKLDNEITLIALNGSDEKKEVSMNLVESLCGKNPKLYDLLNNSGAVVEDGKLILKPMSENVFIVNK